MKRTEVKHHKNIGICTVKTAKGQFTLVYQGPIKLLKRARKVAIVGSRNASNFGLRCARVLAREFGRQGVAIVSGYAKGIDTEAHQGALEAKKGATMVVLPEGIMNFDPKNLAHISPSWQKRTLVLSQFGPDTKWSPTNAMMRNEIVCQLADAVIIVEAGPEKDESGKMSGSFQAGKTALRLKVPLFVVVPETLQSSLDNNAIWICPEGNRQLLDKGAMELRIDPTNLVESARDAVKKVLEVIRQSKEHPLVQESSERKKKRIFEQAKLIETSKAL